ncbi:hypothetical protein [Laceyella putida]|uniref:Uncharacterized protein n=1 Tax=Laceyella putida TaxID=110101 RepID=A0ABW2RRL8_9BACL
MNYPKRCPITELPFYGVVTHPDRGEVPVYGEDQELYTIPVMNDDGEFYRYQYLPDIREWDPVPEFVNTLEEQLANLLKMARSNEVNDWWRESTDYVLGLVR